MIREINEPDFNNTFGSNSDDSLMLNISDLSGIEDESFMKNDSKDSKDSKALSITIHDFDSDFDSRPSEGCHYSEALVSREMGRDNSNAQNIMNEVLNQSEISQIQDGNLSEHSSDVTEMRNIESEHQESDPPSEISHRSDNEELPRRPSMVEVGQENVDFESQDYIRRTQNISSVEQNYIDRIALLRDEFDRRDSVRIAEIERVHHFYSRRIKLSDQKIRSVNNRMSNLENNINLFVKSVSNSINKGF